MLINWHDSYSIHNKKIDEQHKMLFELAKKAALMGNKYTSREEIKDILAEFFDYMKVHFSDEEALMESIGYPDLDDHKKLHKYIIQELASTILNIKNVNDMKEKLGVIAQEWLLNHILHHDMLIEKYRAKTSAQAENANREQKPTEEEEPAATVEEKVAPKKKEGYYYKCKCEGKLHVVSKNIYIDIEKNSMVYKCKKCGSAIKYTGHSYFETP
jgi:hemerythrin